MQEATPSGLKNWRQVSWLKHQLPGHLALRWRELGKPEITGRNLECRHTTRHYESLTRRRVEACSTLCLTPHSRTNPTQRVIYDGSRNDVIARPATVHRSRYRVSHTMILPSGL